MACASMVLTSFFPCPTPISTRLMTISRASPATLPRRSCAPVRLWLRCGRRPVADLRWATKRRAAAFLTQVKKACRIGQKLRALGIRQGGIVRIDSAASPSEWAKDPDQNTKRIAQTFREACTIAEGSGERLAAEGEICWAGMHSWRRNVQLLEMGGRPGALGFQADMAHTMLFTMGYNAPEDRLLPENFDWAETDRLAEAYRKMAGALRPWTIDLHIAQNDGTVKGSGSHDK